MNIGGGAQVLVLSGGGVLGAAQSGMLEVLHATGWRPDVIIGVSAGALNGSVIASDYSAAAIARLQRVWTSQPARGPFPTRTAGQLWRAAHSGSLQDAGPLRELLASACPIRMLEDTTIPLHVAATALGSGITRWFSTGRALDILYASAAIPGILPAATIDGELYVDGATVANVPVGYATSFDPARIVVLDVSTDASKLPLPTTPLAIVLRSLSHARAAVTAYEFASVGADIDVHHIRYGGPPGLRPQEFHRTRELIDGGRAAMATHLARAPIGALVAEAEPAEVPVAAVVETVVEVPRRRRTGRMRAHPLAVLGAFRPGLRDALRPERV